MMINFKRRVILVVLSAFFLSFQLIPNVLAQEKETGVVIKGAILLGEVPLKRTDGRYVYPDLGYLPVGTIVFFTSDQESKTLWNDRDNAYEPYVHVETNIGLSGLLHKSLKKDLTSEPILVPVHKDVLKIFSKNSTKTKTYPLGSISRSSGEYLSVIDDKDPDFYLVTLPWTKQENRKPDKGKIFKRAIQEGKFLLLSKSTAIQSADSPIIVSRKIYFDETSPNDYEKKVFKKLENLGLSTNKIKTFLKSQDWVDCNLSTSAKVGISTEFFIKIGVEGSINLKNESQFYEIFHSSYTLGQNKKKFFTTKFIKCEDGSANRMIRSVFQEDLDDKSKQINIYLREMPDYLRKNWNLSLKAPAQSRKMIVIDGPESYSLYFSFMEKNSNDNDYLLRFSKPEKRALFTLILHEIAQFKKSSQIYQ